MAIGLVIVLVLILGLTGAMKPVLCTVDRLIGGDAASCEAAPTGGTASLGSGGLPAATDERLANTGTGDVGVDLVSGVGLVSGKTGTTLAAEVRRLADGPLRPGAWWDGQSMTADTVIDGQRGAGATPGCAHEDEPTCDMWDGLRMDPSGSSGTGPARLAQAGLDPLIDTEDTVTTWDVDLTVPSGLGAGTDDIVPTTAHVVIAAHSRDGSTVTTYVLDAVTTTDEGAGDVVATKDSLCALVWQVERDRTGHVTLITARRAMSSPTAEQATAVSVTTVTLAATPRNRFLLDALADEVVSNGVPVLAALTWYPTRVTDDPLVTLLHSDASVDRVVALPAGGGLPLSELVQDESWVDAPETTVLERRSLGVPNAIGTRQFEDQSSS